MVEERVVDVKNEKLLAGAGGIQHLHLKLRELTRGQHVEVCTIDDAAAYRLSSSVTVFHICSLYATEVRSQQGLMEVNRNRQHAEKARVGRAPCMPQLSARACVGFPDGRGS